MRNMPLLLAGLLCAPPAFASEQLLHIGIGVYVFCGADFEGAYRLPNSPYQVGFLYQSCTSKMQDPFAGTTVTEETESSSGPFLNYLFSPEDKSTFYVGVALFNWSTTETYLVPGGPPGASTSSSDSTTDLYFGGGYTSDWGESGYVNLGLYASPTAKLETKTVGSSTKSSGGMGLQARIGIRF